LGCTQRRKDAEGLGSRGAGGQGCRGPGVFASLRLREVVDLEACRVEPYVACQFIYGPESDRPGEGSYSWATGTAAWTLVVVWEWMPGARPELD
jgi:hypothetical protein